MNKYIHSGIQLLFFIMLATIVVAGIWMSLPRYRQVRRLQAQKGRILKKIEEKRLEIQEVKAKQHRFNTDRDFVEQLARQSRRVFPGELVFVFDN